jgi:hypothetical protein
MHKNKLEFLNTHKKNLYNYHLLVINRKDNYYSINKKFYIFFKMLKPSKNNIIKDTILHQMLFKPYSISPLKHNSYITKEVDLHLVNGKQ